MVEFVEYICSQCDITVAIIISAPPVDIRVIGTGLNKHFFNCPRCYETMEKEVKNQSEIESQLGQRIS